MASAGFEPANLGTKGQHATPRPPKLLLDVQLHSFLSLLLGVVSGQGHTPTALSLGKNPSNQWIVGWGTPKMVWV